ncbi:MAG TPA: DUF2059 domain-containing protein [Terriglobales bacterium]
MSRFALLVSNMAVLSSMIVLSTMLAGPCLLAQQPAAPEPTAPKTQAKTAATDGPPTAEQVTKLLELLQVRDSLQVTLDAVKKQLRNSAEEQFRDKILNPSPQQLKSIQGIVDDVFGDLSADDMIKDVVPVYQKHLTRSDVRALVAFYSSPPGQKILREQPAMVRESMQAAGASQQKKMEVVLAKLDVRVQQLIEQEQGKGEPKK